MDLIEKKRNHFRHPWELSRTSQMIKELKKFRIHGDILDVGCGDHYFDEKLVEECEAIDSIYGIDIFRKESDLDDGKFHYYNTYEKINKKQFDFILMMDVLEHVDDDVSFTKMISRFMHENTILFITVPAFQWLFSEHDKELKHYRRYNRKMLNNTLTQACRLKIMEESYFYSLLLPIRFLTRNQKNQTIGGWSHGETKFITKFIKNLLDWDYTVIRKLSEKGLYIGGLSLLIIAKYIPEETLR